MNSTLTQAQKDEIRQSLLHNTFSLGAEIAKLMKNGYDEATAKALIIAEVNEYKQGLPSYGKVDDSKLEEARKGIAILIPMISLLGVAFGSFSAIWNIITIAGSGVAGYYAFRTKPIAGIIGGIIVPVILPFAYNWYVSGRTRIIKFELFIPLAMAVIPAYIVFSIISKTVYARSGKVQ